MLKVIVYVGAFVLGWYYSPRIIDHMYAVQHKHDQPQLQPEKSVEESTSIGHIPVPIVEKLRTE